VTTFDPTSLGTDCNVAMNDVPGSMGLASGLPNLGNALVRRLSCPPGGNFYDDDYSDIDVTDLVNSTNSPADINRYQSLIASTCEKDERIDTADATVTQDQATGDITILITGNLATGQPFAFVMAASGATVALLEINGVSVAAVNTGTAAAPGVQLVIGPPGPAGIPGIPGTPGAGGTPSWAGGSGADDWTSPPDGTEAVVFEAEIVWSDLPATVTITLAGDFYVSGGSGVFKLSRGGTLGNADGTTVGAPLTTTNATPTPGSISATIANPGGTSYLKVTAQATTVGKTAGVAAHGITIR
jgi:hypothetical protein